MEGPVFPLLIEFIYVSIGLESTNEICNIGLIHKKSWKWGMGPLGFEFLSGGQNPTHFRGLQVSPWHYAVNLHSIIPKIDMAYAGQSEVKAPV